MKHEPENRSVQTELRADAAGGDGGRLLGYAASYNVLSHDLGGFREKIAPGAFRNAIKRGDDVRFLWNHKPDLLMGRTKSGTLQLSEDSRGLHFACSLPNTQAARDLRESVMRGDTDECSFGFVAEDEDYDENGIDPESGRRCIVRTLRSLRLLDCSAVTYPAYPETQVSARSRKPDYIIRINLANDFLRRHNAVLGAEIAASDSRAAVQDELRERMQNAAGIVFGRKR